MGGVALNNTIKLPIKTDLNKLRQANALVSKINKSVSAVNKPLEKMASNLNRISQSSYKFGENYNTQIKKVITANEYASKSAKSYASAAASAYREVNHSVSGSTKPINQTREAYRKATQETKLFGRAQRSNNGSTSGLGKAKTQIERLGNSFTSATKKTHKFRNVMLGVAGGAIGFTGLNAISSGIHSMIGELNDSSKAWQTFNGNLKMNGYSDKRIKSVRNDLQKFAQQTIYNSSEMASTYSQLDAVGTKHTARLVKGFGGLAAAADDPAQAMKSLSQQAVQMAAKPKVQWQDLRIMMEQAPAGISAVAKAMHTSTDGLIRDVQSGKVSSKEFLDMIGKVGTNKNFAKMATQYKTVGQAMDGMRETIANKLMPSYQDLSKEGIKSVSGITDAINSIPDKKIQQAVDPVLKHMESYINYVINNGPTFGSIFKSMGQITGNIAKGAWKAFSDTISIIAGHLPGAKTSLKDVAKYLDDIAKHKTALKIIGGSLAGLFMVSKAAKFAKYLGAIATSVKTIGKSGGVLGRLGSLTGIASHSSKQSGKIGTFTISSSATKKSAKSFGKKAGTTFGSYAKSAGKSSGKNGGKQFAKYAVNGGYSAGKKGGSKFSKAVKGLSWATLGVDVGSHGVNAFKYGVNSKKGGKELWEGAGTALGGSVGMLLGGPTGMAIGATIGKAIGNYLSGLKIFKEVSKGTQKNSSKYDKSHGKGSMQQMRTGYNQLQSGNTKKLKKANKKMGSAKQQGINLNQYAGYASGSSIKRNQLALVGEQGTEMAYNARTGRVRMLGTNGPAMEKLFAGEHILNARDTKKAIRGGIGAGRTLPGYANGTSKLVKSKNGGKTAKLSLKTNDFSKDFTKSSKKTTKSLTGLAKKSKQNWKSIQSDTGKSSKKIHKDTVSEFDTMQKNSVVQLKQLHSQSNKNAKATVSDFNSIFGRLGKYAKSGMDGALRQINKGISGINSTFSQFGGNAQVLKPIKYAKGSNGRIKTNQIAKLNDATTGPRQEAIVHNNGAVSLPNGKDSIHYLHKGERVLNGRQTEEFIRMGGQAYAKGTGVGKSSLKKLAKNSQKHYASSFNSEYKSKIEPSGSKFTQGVASSARKGATGVGYPWNKAIWQVINDAISGGGAGGPVTHSPGAGWGVSSGFGNRGSVGGGYSSHDGVDYSGAKTVHAMNTGKVTHAGGAPANWGGPRGIGQNVVVAGGGLSYIYQELNGKNNSGAKLLVSVGDTVKAGQAIAKLGPAGTHVHVGATHHKMFSIGGSSTAGWLDPRDVTSKAVKTNKSSKKDSALEKLAKKQLGKKALSWISDKLGESDGAGGAGPAPTGSHKHWMEQAGIPSSWFAGANKIISAESGWNPKAQNPSSSAYGIPQALPGSKMASAGSDWKTNPITQLKWFKSYIKSRYGSMAKALSFRGAHGWYANGGWSKGGQANLFGEVPGEPEIAINPKRSSADTLIAQAIKARTSVSDSSPFNGLFESRKSAKARKALKCDISNASGSKIENVSHKMPNITINNTFNITGNVSDDQIDETSSKFEAAIQKAVNKIMQNAFNKAELG